tara:strand:- start:60 stop:272 length:213 start_codon:yes stop_codon:yes gene_type:complete
MVSTTTLLVVVLVLALFSTIAYHIISRHDSPPLWWPQFLRPKWDKDPEEFTDPMQIKRDEEGVADSRAML